TLSSVSFFEPLPPPPSGGTNGPPEGALGVVVPVGELLGRGSDAAVVLDYLRVFATGFMVALALVKKPGTPPGPPPFGPPRPGQPPGERLGFPRLGVKFSDGRRGGHRGRPVPGGPFGPGGTPEPGELTLRSIGGSGGLSGNFSMTYWVAPLPPPGDVDIYL